MNFINIRNTILIASFLVFTFYSGNYNAFSQPGELQWGPAGTQCTTNTVPPNGNLGVQPVCTGGPGGNATLLNGVDATVTLAFPGTTTPGAVAPIANAACSTDPTLMQNCPGVMPSVPGLGNNFQYLSMTSGSDDCSAQQSVTIDFDPPITNPSFTLGDIDNGSAASPPANWQDLVIVTAVPDGGGNVSANSVVLGGANVAQVTAGTNFPGTACSTGTLSCPNNATCFRGLSSTNSNSAASNATLSYSGDIESITVTYYAGDVINTISAQFIALGPISWTDTLPVTLSSFSSSYGSGGVVVDWSTSTETINIGFNLYAHIDGERVIFNEEMIQSHNGDSVVPQYYEEVVNVPEGATELSISSVDIYGTEEFFGPYEIGGSYGEEPVASKIEWKEIKEKYNQKMAGKGFEMKAGKMRAAAPEEQGLVSSFIARVGIEDSPVCNIAVSEEGMHRVRMRDLRKAGCDFRGEDIDDIALTFKGEPVSRRIHSNNGKVKNGTNIFFYADTPSGKDYLYTTENVYQVSVDPDLADVHEDLAKPKKKDVAGFEESYMHEVVVEKNLNYNFTTPYGEVNEFDPWTENNMSAGAGSTSTYSYEISVLSDVDTTREGKIKTRLIAVTDFPEETIDHKVLLNLNSGADKGPFTQEGRANWYIETPVDGSDLTAGINNLDITVGGVPVFDFMRTDSYGLMYWRPTASIDDVLSFTEYGEVSGYNVSGYSVKNVQVYGEKEGQLYKLKTRKKNDGGEYTVSFKNLGEGARYWASPVSEFNTAVITKAEEGDIKSGSADVLILTHPALTGAELDAYESYVNGEGYTTKVANVLNVYDYFGYGMPTPEGIRKYLEYAKDNLSVEYVAIVGGTTTEYPDPSTSESVQYIPTEFELTQDLIYYTPCDGCMADFNGDFVPELKIFRIPSRQVSDTGAVAAKSTNYETDSSVLLLAEHTQEQDFGAQLDAVSSQLGGYDEMKYYLSDIMADNGVSVNDAVCIAQQGASCPACPADKPCNSMTGFINDINSNDKRLIMFNGHSSIVGWTFNGLLTNVIAENDLTNTEPTVVIPMACYTTYYENPGTASLADQLLFKATGGSVAVSGAATLSSLGDNGLYADSILEKMCDGVTTLVDAVHQTKQENPGLTDQVINWDLIGNGFVKIAQCEEVVPEPPDGEVVDDGEGAGGSSGEEIEDL